MYPDSSHLNYYKGEITGSHPSQKPEEQK